MKKSLEKIPGEFLEERMEEISGEILVANLQRTSWRKPPKKSLENPRKKFWRKSSEELINEFLDELPREHPG